jgi:hypothetical protein
MKRTSEKTSFDLFTKIIAKALDYGCFEFYDLLNWTEPFLHPELHVFQEHLKSMGVKTRLSSNLSLRKIPHLIATLKHVDDLFISTSGFTQQVHSFNHRKSNIDTVKWHLREIEHAKKLGIINTNVYVRFLDFGYNTHEAITMKAYVEDMGFSFWQDAGWGNPYEEIAGDQSKFPDPTSATWRSTNEALNAIRQARPCSFIQEDFPALSHVTLDCRGDVFICCGLRNIPETRVGNFLEDDLAVLHERRLTSVICKTCIQYASPAVLIQLEE